MLLLVSVRFNLMHHHHHHHHMYVVCRFSSVCCNFYAAKLLILDNGENRECHGESLKFTQFNQLQHPTLLQPPDFSAFHYGTRFLLDRTTSFCCVCWFFS